MHGDKGKHWHNGVGQRDVVACRHTRVEPYIQQHPDANGEVRDIEELVRLGQGRGPCPYYLSRCAEGWQRMRSVNLPHIVNAGSITCDRELHAM